MKDNCERGEDLISEAQRIIHRDLEGALQEEDFNMVVRRAQEVVEFTLKGGLKILGVEYPKEHDVGKVFGEAVRKKVKNADEPTLEKIATISKNLKEDRAPSFYGEKHYAKKEANDAYNEAIFVFKEVKEILNV